MVRRIIEEKRLQRLLVVGGYSRTKQTRIQRQYKL